LNSGALLTTPAAPLHTLVSVQHPLTVGAYPEEESARTTVVVPPWPNVQGGLAKWNTPPAPTPEPLPRGAIPTTPASAQRLALWPVGWVVASGCGLL